MAKPKNDGICYLGKYKGWLNANAEIVTSTHLKRPLTRGIQTFSVCEIEEFSWLELTGVHPGCGSFPDWG